MRSLDSHDICTFLIYLSFFFINLANVFESHFIEANIWSVKTAKPFLSRVNSTNFSIYQQYHNHSVSHAMERDKLIQESYVVGQYQVRSESPIPFISQCPSQQDNTTYIKVAQSMLELNQARTQDSQFCPDVQIRDSSQWEKHDDQRVICPWH